MNMLLFPFVMLFFVWVMTFAMMLRFKWMYDRATAREHRYANMVEQLTARRS